MELKIAFLIIVAGVSNALAVPTYSQVAKVSLDMKNARLEQVMDNIESQSEFYFIFNQKQIDVNRTVNIRAENELITDILLELFKGTNVNYVVLDRKILLTTDPLENKLLAVPLPTEPQQFTVKGTVTDAATGEALPGVNIVIKGTTNGVIADINGRYTLEVSNKSATLQFSFIGYVSQEIVLNGQTTLDITLTKEVAQLNEVVIVGYGTMKKRDITGSIASISSKDLDKVKVTSIDQTLQGNVSGVMVTQSSGQPGSPPAIMIRGAGRFGTTEPLYIIDNVIVQGYQYDQSQSNYGVNANPLAGLNPDDIESIEVLKDAGAAAIYGARAGNGVIIITTKRGKKGQMKVSFDQFYGIQSVAKKLNMLNTSQYFDYYKAATGQTHPKDTPENRLINTDWQDLIFKNATKQNYTLNISGGNEYATYSVSGGYLKQDGVLNASGFERYSLRATADFKITKRITFGQTLNVSRTSNKVNDNGGQWYSLIGNALKMPPYITPYTTDPEFIGGYNGPLNIDMADISNPLTRNLTKVNDHHDRLLSNTYAQVEILDGLRYKINLGIDVGANLTDTWTPSYFAGDYDNSLVAKLTHNDGFSLGVLIENTLGYFKAFGKHNFNVVLGVSQQKNTTNGHYMMTTLDNNIQGDFDAGAASDSKTVGGVSSDYLMRSQFGRVNYDYNGKYLFSATLRRDGSSRFGPENRYGVFPAFSVGWRLSKENFLSNVAILSDLKLYGSWGMLGNDGIGNYLYASNVVSGFNYPFMSSSGGDVLTFGKATLQLGNAALKWESTQTSNFGLSGSLLQNKINFEVEYYIKKTNNLLIQSLPLPATAGALGPASNAASIENKGLDMLLGYHGNEGEFRYSVTGNISFYLENKVLSLGSTNTPIMGGDKSILGGSFCTKTELGGPVGAFYGYKMEGIWQVADSALMKKRQPTAQAGDIRFADIDKDGTITANDQTRIGNPNPKFFFGLNLSGEYKGFDLSVLLQGVVGNNIFNAYGKGFGAGMRPIYNQTTIVLDGWTPENKSNTVPRIGNNPDNYQMSSWYVENGSYMRIKNVQLGYTLPQSILKSAKISSLRVYVSSQNLFTFTKYTGYDPEVGAWSGQNTSRAIDVANYPSTRDFMFGIQFMF